jgi:hypothetical protein
MRSILTIQHYDRSNIKQSIKIQSQATCLISVTCLYIEDIRGKILSNKTTWTANCAAQALRSESYYEQPYEDRMLKNLKRRAKQMGYTLLPEKALVRE